MLQEDGGDIDHAAFLQSAVLEGSQGADGSFEDGGIGLAEVLPALNDAFLPNPDDGDPQVFPELFDGPGPGPGPGPVRPEAGDPLWSLQHSGDNPLIVDGPHGPHLLQEDVGHIRRLTDFDLWH